MTIHSTIEKNLRKKLGIPASAKKVLMLGETSHWDPNWIFTTHEYFNFRIRTILDTAIEELTKDTKRIFSIECVFFLKMYWENCPDKRSAIKKLVNEGRLRLTGSGLTTPDTTLPETEALLRDYQRGQTWLLENGMKQEPSLAYFPDGFGHSPGVPSILRSMGYKYAAVTRIDGMTFPGADYRPKWYFPRPSSCAWILLKELKTQDFYWKAPDNSKVLCHWNSFTYFHGDNIVYMGPVKWMGMLLGVTRRSESHVAKRIADFVKQLEPLSKTPYLFLPIGLDFNPPIEDLGGLIRRYNKMRFKETGVWATIAGMDDYLDLVSCYKHLLPELELDFNPYWMGFYSSRPNLKKQCKNLSTNLVKAEKLTLMAEDYAKKKRANFFPKELANTWDALVLTNHHDFITGTSHDKVYKVEQQKSIRKTKRDVEAALSQAINACPSPPRGKKNVPPKWNTRKGQFKIESKFYTIELNAEQGGCITSWIDKKSGINFIAGLGNDVVLHEDSGGLWRMGHEFRGGKFYIIDRASNHKAHIFAREINGLLEIEIESILDGKTLVRKLWFKNDSPIVRMRAGGKAAKKRTATVRFSTIMNFRSLSMDVPGGVVNRPPQKIFEPTFWGAKSFVHLREEATDLGMAVALGGPACLSGESNGIAEWVALRNAPKETAYGIFPVMAHPVAGYEYSEQILEYAVWFTPKGDWQSNSVKILAEDALRQSWLKPSAADYDRLADSLATVNNKHVKVGAVKEADRGNGIIIRLYSFATPDTSVNLSYKGKRIKTAWLCDALERNLSKLKIQNGQATVPLPYHITSVRITL